MSFVNDLAFGDQRSLEQDALSNPAPTNPEPSFWDGSGSALFSGIAQGAVQLTLQAAQYGNDPSQAILMDIPSDEDELARREAISEQRNWATDQLRPTAETSGTAAQVFFGLGDAVTTFAIGGASGGLPVAAATVGGSMGEQRYSELRRDGVDAGTAVIAGAIEGTAVAAGAFLPAARIFAGPALDAAATVGANVGLGVVARGGVGAVLEQNGYTQQAQQYKALDATAMAIDGLLGGAFWGLGRAMSRSASPETIDAALAGNNGLHAQHGTAPGAPVDARSSAAHQNSLDLAIQQMARGEPVNVESTIGDASFIRSDRVGPEPEVIRQQAEQDVFASARAELEPIAAAGIPNVRELRAEAGGLQRSIDDVDSARQKVDAQYRDLAKSFQREGNTRKQAERAARDSIAQQRQAIEEQAAASQSRLDEINHALEANRASERARADLAAIDRGETPARLEPEVARRAEEMGGAFRKSAIASSVAPDHGQTLNRLAAQEIQNLLRQGGQIADDAPVASILRDEPVPFRPRAADAPRDVSQSEASNAPAETAPAARTDASEITPGSELDGIDPALTDLIDSIVTGSRDIQIPTGALNDDGTPTTVSARQLLDDADAEIARANNDSKGFLAAALCALRFGD